MRIASLATALPVRRYEQQTLLQAAHAAWDKHLDNPAVLDRLFRRVGVDSRHLCLPMEAYPALANFREKNDAWISGALELGCRAIKEALESSGIDAEKLGALFFVSITGIANPSIDARILNLLGLPRNVKRLPIFGLGCVAGAAGIARAADYVRAYPDQVAVLLSVELCSLTVQANNLSMPNLIATALFGDGAAAVVVTGEDVPATGPRIVATQSNFYPQTEHAMGWDITENGFEIVLSPQVPGIVRENLAPDVDSFLERNGLSRNDITSWIMHTGGPAILEATAEALNLSKCALEASWECLRRIGNLSSASVLFVLEDFLHNRRPPALSYSILAAMGPGFCSELVLLQW
ncbi:MAG: type III polyketide synthase [Bryobacteraceae bacterium]